jgi:hypothetical protein
VTNSDLSETALRFTLAHELAHHLVDLDADDVLADEGKLEAARYWFDPPPIEKRANAFAAMFLAPSDSVAALIGQPRAAVPFDEARTMSVQVANAFGLGFVACAWHLHNLKYWDDSMSELLVKTEPTSPGVTGFEESTRFDGLERRVFHALTENRISLSRARELIGRRVDEHASAFGEDAVDAGVKP